MDLGTLKSTVAGNIARLRKAAGLTQAEVAEKLNYSDKAVSKWERGESMPDVATMVQLSTLFGVTLNDLVGQTSRAPEEETGRHAPTIRVRKTVVAALASILVWFIALLVFVILSYCGVHGGWIGFVAAVPVNAIVLLSLLSAWRFFRLNKLLISVLIWGILALIVIIFKTFAQISLLRVFLLGIPAQLATLLWFRLYRKEPKEETSHGQETAAQSDSGAEAGHDDQAD